MGIKSVQRFSLKMGVANLSGTNYYTWGSASQISSTQGIPAASVSSDGAAGRFCFVTLGANVNPNKTFLTHSFTGHAAATNEAVEIRMYNASGYPSSSTTSFNVIQIISRDNWPTSSYQGSVSEAPQISVEVVEFE